MPEEVAIMTLLVISVIAGTIMLASIARSYFRYLGEKAGVKKEKSSGSSLTTSELELMLKRVVDESNASLVGRIEKLENQLPAQKSGSKALPAHESDAILDELDGPRDLAAISQRKSRTV